MEQISIQSWGYGTKNIDFQQAKGTVKGHDTLARVLPRLAKRQECTNQ
jgi:hypothetical protein